MNLHEVILEPLITEKSEIQKSRKEGSNSYSFIVHRKANKELIRQALKFFYGVRATKINVLNTIGKEKRFRNQKYMQNTLKKAVVTLVRGQSIEFVAKEK